MNIYDIAKLSGVSIATVSRVLNGSQKVSEKTRRRVEAVIQEQAYTPNVFARGLGLDSMKMVGVLCTDVADPFFACAVSVLEQQLKHRGYTPMLFCTGNELRGKQEAVEVLLEKRVDAMVLVGSPFREQTDNQHIEKAAQTVPVIVVNGLLQAPNVYCVVCDECRAVYENTIHLIQQGHRRILYCYDVTTYSGLQKLAGYQKALAEMEIPWDDSLVVQVPKSFPKIYEKIGQIHKEQWFDAAEASEDYLAAGILKVVGDTVPVIGFNNSVIGECTTPALSSVDNRVEELCIQAIQLLENLFQGKSCSSVITLDPVFVQRESCRFETGEIADKENT
ncbi:MAG: LacI family DNA-binding transcriptional regulator [Massiliimalia sp.]